MILCFVLYAADIDTSRCIDFELIIIARLMDSMPSGLYCIRYFRSQMGYSGAMEQDFGEGGIK